MFAQMYVELILIVFWVVWWFLYYVHTLGFFSLEYTGNFPFMVIRVIVKYFRNFVWRAHAQTKYVIYRDHSARVVFTR